MSRVSRTADFSALSAGPTPHTARDVCVTVPGITCVELRGLAALEPAPAGS